MEIRLSIHTTRPLSGAAKVEPGEPVAFEGWLELLSVLATLTGAEEYPDVEGTKADRHHLSRNRQLERHLEAGTEHEDGDEDNSG